MKAVFDIGGTFLRVARALPGGVSEARVEATPQDPETGVKSLEALGLDGRNLEAIQAGLKRPYGMILLTGPTGSGKTTTLYAMLQTLNKERYNIVSLEDPIEYNIEGVNQSQVRPEINYDFASGLRSILRQDPDIIMVGEIRDRETAGPYCSFPPAHQFRHRGHSEAYRYGS